MSRFSSEFAQILDQVLQNENSIEAAPGADPKTSPLTFSDSDLTGWWVHMNPNPSPRRSARPGSYKHSQRPTEQAPLPPPLVAPEAPRFNPPAPQKAERRLAVNDLSKTMRLNLQQFYRHVSQAIPEHICESELRAHFRRLARRYHPDSHIGQSTETLARNGIEFGRIKALYDTLKKHLK